VILEATRASNSVLRPSLESSLRLARRYCDPVQPLKSYLVKGLAKPEVFSGHKKWVARP
jgi:hypothetical protein